MSKYIDPDKIRDLIAHREKIFEQHQAAYEKYGIDILANDTLSALSMWEIVSQYDQNYNTNFHRNGEDAKSGQVLIEQKCATKEHTQRTGLVGLSGWQFHAQGNLQYPRYIFAVRRKDNLQIVRIWDVQSNIAIKTVQQHLFAMKQRWIDRGKPNHDAIVLPEKLLIDLPKLETMTINNCTVHKI